MTDHTDTLRDLVTAIGLALGPAWRINPRDDEYNNHYAELHGLDGAVLGFHVVSYPRPARLWIRGEYPRTKCASGDYGPSEYRDPGKRPKISVNPTRPPDAIAKEIARRILPIYLPELPAAYARKADAEAANATGLEVARALAALTGARLRDHAADDLARGGTVELFPDGPIYRLKVHPGGRIHADLGYRNFDLAAVTALWELLAKYPEAA